MHILAGFLLSPVPFAKTLFGNVEGNNAATVGRWRQQQPLKEPLLRLPCGLSFSSIHFFFCGICIIPEHVIRGLCECVFLRVGVDGDFCNHRHYQVAQSATSPSFKLNDDGSGSGIRLLLFSSSGGKQCLQGMRKLSKESKGREVWAGTSDILFCIYLIIIPNHWGLKLSSKDPSHPQVYLIWVINVERG